MAQALSGAPNAPGQNLAPSVELAYKKKCVELKRRLNEIEKHNDEQRRKKMQLDTGIRKLKLERAILLDHLGKVVDLNKQSIRSLQPNGHPREVDEGMVDQAHNPKERSGRSKRGHRQSSLPTLLPTPAGQAPTFQVQTPSNMIPSAQHGTQITYSANPMGAHSTPSHMNLPRTTTFVPMSTHSNALHTQRPPTPQGRPPRPPTPPVRPRPPFEIFVRYQLDEMVENGQRVPPVDEIEPIFRPKWSQLSLEERQPWEQKYEEQMGAYTKELDAFNKARRSGRTVAQELEDLDMKESIGEAEAPAAGGFTAVNR
ncbi:MAG: hypothetical protein M1834_002153 [Cirrosporium novae-zelandiae]|nr:MAG: hypothetical protein M1834_002153 [Cirrosporium novae-zelandiae]